MTREEAVSECRELYRHDGEVCEVREVEGWSSSVSVRKYPAHVGRGTDPVDKTIATARAWRDIKAQVRARGGI